MINSDKKILKFLNIFIIRYRHFSNFMHGFYFDFNYNLLIKKYFELKDDES